MFNNTLFSLSLANAAAAAVGVLFFMSYFPVFFLRDERYQLMSRSEKMAASLLSNVAMSFGINTIMLYEGTGKISIRTCISDTTNT